MKKILPIFLILLSVCAMVHAQDVGNVTGMNASPNLQQHHQDDATILSSQQQKDEQLQLQLANKRLQVANQLSQIKQWYNSQDAYLTINDGWHSAYVTDNDLYVSPFSLDVIGGRVVSIGKTNVSSSTIIEKGRCQITAMGTDNKMHTLDIYFLQ